MPENDLLKSALLQSNLQGFVIADEITNVDRLKVAICGDYKTGKSSIVARTARKPVAFYDFDDRKESIAGQKDVIVKTLYDKNDTTPTAWAEFESDIGTMEYLKQKSQLPFKSLALDSMTYLRKYAEHQALKDNQGITRNKFKVSNQEYLVPKDWDAVTSIQHMMDTMLNRLFSLDIDIYVTFHTRLEKDQNKSTKTDIVYKEKLTIDPPNLKILLGKFNDQWRTYIEDGKYMVQLKPNWQFDAATVLKGVAAEEEADIQKMLEKHHKVVK